MLALPIGRGCCPVCDRPVARVMRSTPGGPVETYACPDHGHVDYGAPSVTLVGWVAHLTGARQADLLDA